MRDARGWGRACLLKWVAVAFALAVAGIAQAVTQDITSQFAVTRSGLVLNRTTNTFDQTVTLRNTAGAPALGPLVAAIGGLPGSVTLYNKTGQTADGKPYVAPLAAGSQLASGASLSFTLKYANPSRVSFSSVLQILYTFELPPNAPNLLGVLSTGATSAYLIGRVEGAANRDIALEVSSSATCVTGTLVGGAVVNAALGAHTDANGYFGVPLQGVGSGNFVSIRTTSPAASPSSPCLVSSRDNDSWPKAFVLDGSPVAVRDLIDAPGRARWYKFPVTPGQRIDVKLSGLPADYDVAVFRDIGQAFASEFVPDQGTTSDLLKLTAEYAPTQTSPMVFSPMVFSPMVFSPDAYSPMVFSPTTYSPMVFSPMVFSPMVFSPMVFSPMVFSPKEYSPMVFSPTGFDADTMARAFSAAQSRSIVAVAATTGLSDEATVVNTWNRTGYFYARITGKGGAFSTSVPFTLSVTKGETSCAAVTDFTVTTRTAVAASGLKTVIVTDSSRVSLDAPLPGDSAGTLRTKLAAFASRSEVAGILVDVAGDDRVKGIKKQAADNPACPFAKNLVAEEIKGIVDAYRANPLQYLVIVGNDDAIPFFRSPDQSVLGRESSYVPPVESNSPSEASLRRDFVLSQDKYGSKTTMSLPWNDFPVPNLAVGRLVETPGEIAGMLDAYLATGGTVVPHSSLVTGYDFLQDAADAVKAELDAGIGAAGSSLIAPNGQAPQNSWTAPQLASALFGSRHDVIFLAGHFSANSALAADFKTSLLTTDLAASTTDFTNSIVFSAGCHAGYNLVDGDAIAGVTLPLDWAQAFARKKATLVAGTGYQYGDTDFIEYSERLYKNFARELRAGTGAVAVGEALVKAKLAYLAATPDIRGLHEKALLEASLFGLPMLGVNMPWGRTTPGATGALVPTDVPARKGATDLGLKIFDLGPASTPALTLAPLVSHTVTLKNVKSGSDVAAAWLSGPDGVVANGGEPVLPLVVADVTPNDPRLVLRGIGYRGGTFVDSAPLLPFTGAPSIESHTAHVPFLSPVHYPTTLWSPNYFGALAGSGGTQLLVTPAQHRAASIADGTSTQRKHTAMNLRLFYSANVSKAALSDAPSIVAVDTLRDGTDAVVTAQVVGDPAAALYQVWVTYTGDGSGQWTSLDLDQCVRSDPGNVLPGACGTTEDSRVWKGRIVNAPANLKHFIQAVNGVGLVSRNDNFGAFFGVPALTPTATTLALVSAPSTATVGDTPAVSAKLTFAGGVALAGKTVSVGTGGAMQLGTTAADGTVAVKIPVVDTQGSVQITATFAGDDIYQPSSASAPLAVNKAAVTPTVLPGSASTAGINISGALGGSSAGLQQVPVAFTVNGPSGTTTVYAITDSFGNAAFPPPSGLPPGDYTVTQATFGGDGIYAPTTITFPTPQHVTVPKLNQSITFDALTSKAFGSADFPVYASASSLLPVTYGATGNCTVAGSTVHLTGTGSCTITADQAGNSNFNPAAQVARTFAIVAPPTVVSVVRAQPNPTMADSVTYTLTFSEAVTGVAAGNFAVTAGGALTGASVGAVSGSGTTWTVAVNTGRSTGSLHLDVVNGTGITNGAGTTLGGLPFAGETYQIDKGGTVLGAGEGQIITGFGTSGYALFGDVPIAATPGRIRVRSNGTIVAAGGTGCAPLVPSDPVSPVYCTLQLARYLASGAPDTSFGTNGRVVTAVTMVNNEVNFSINNDGTYLVRGIRRSGAEDVPFAARFTSAGAADPSFGTGGVVTLDSLPLGFRILGSVVDPSGRIVIVGSTRDTGVGERQDIFVTRLTSSGATDAGFGTGGVAQFALSTVDNRSDRGTTIDVQPDGMIVIGGRTKVTAGLGYDFLLMRLDTSGVRDPSFGTNGVVTARFPTSTGDNLGRRLVLQPDGKIALIGTVVVGAENQCGIARFDANGVLDPGFGTGGQVLVGLSVGCFNANQQPDGKLVVVGNDQVGDVTYGSFARLLRTGVLDASFGTGGVIDISNFDTPTRVAFTSSGNLVTALTIQDPVDGVLKSYLVELTTTLTGPWVAQTITFGALPDRTYGDAFPVSATASSGLPVSFAASGACAVVGNAVQVTGIGSCTITASQAGDATWFAATPVPRTFNIAAASQVIAFAPAPVGVTVGQPLVMIAASSSSPTAAPTTNPIVYSVLTPPLTSPVCTIGGIGGTTLTLLAPGTCTIAANQAGDANYDGAPQATLDIPVGPAGTPPSTFEVKNLSDNGTDSLRWAIGQANSNPGPDTVVFQSGLTGTVTLTTGQIQISGPLSIVGPGAGAITIDGNANDRIFGVWATDPACPAVDGPDYLVSISGLRLQNGQRNVAGSGSGAIYSGHSLALDSMVFANNIARSGGAVGVSIQYSGQTLTISNSQFLSNTATELSTPADTFGVNGGAVHVTERCSNVNDVPYTQPVTVTISNSDFIGNSALALSDRGGRGGALRSWSLADISITDTVIVANHADAPPSLPNPPLANQTYRGGAFDGTAKSLRIERSEIAENTVYDATGSDATRSGGLHLHNTAVDRQTSGAAMAVRIIDSTVSGNHASATCGAMVATGNVDLALYNATVASNTAAPTRTGGICLSGNTLYPSGTGATLLPRLALTSSILALNSSTAGDLTATTGSFGPLLTVNATGSLVQKVCASPGCMITFVGPFNLLGTDPLMAPLAEVPGGAPLRTHALLPGSPAINAGSNPLGLTWDQRGPGFPRSIGAGTDMGAFESTSP